ncbi:MAG TPA: hypothetical protein VGH90_05320, partial [Chthoniobacteraceae bacterium]
MSSNLLERILRRRLALAVGAILGIAAVGVLAKQFHYFAPLFDEPTSAWAASGTDAPEQRKAATLYGARVDYLLQRIRANGRVGASDWQSLREAADAWLLSDPIGCLNHLSSLAALPFLDENLLDEALRREGGGNFSTALRRADELTDPRNYRLWLTHAFRLEM